MKLAKALLGGMWAVVGILALLAEDAWSRPPTEVCQSDGRYQYCPANTRGGVRLQRQLSKSPCIPNQTWGFDRGGIWVNKGCRAAACSPALPINSAFAVIRERWNAK